MASPDIPDNLRQFIFEHVDSLAQLEVLFFMRARPEQWFDAETLSREMRSSSQVVGHALALLLRIGLLIEGEPNKFRYGSRSPELDQLIVELNDFYKLKPHKVLELIFSSVKRARQFADAFAITKTPKPDEGDNG